MQPACCFYRPIGQLLIQPVAPARIPEQGSALAGRNAEPDRFFRRDYQVSTCAKHEHWASHALDDARQRKSADQSREVFLTARNGRQVSPQQGLSSCEPSLGIKGWSYGNDGPHLVRTSSAPAAATHGDH